MTRSDPHARFQASSTRGGPAAALSSLARAALLVPAAAVPASVRIALLVLAVAIGPAGGQSADADPSVADTSEGRASAEPPSGDTAAAGPAEVRVEPESLTVAAGDSVRFRATAFDEAGDAIAGSRFFWVLDGDLSGAVDSTGLYVAGSPAIGLVIAIPAGGEVAGGALIRVTPAPLVSLEIRGPARLPAGAFARLEVTGTDRTGAERPVADATWTSSAPGVVEVEPGGAIVAREPGQATVKARSGEAEGTFAVEIRPSSARGLEIACDGCGGPVEDGTLRVRVGDPVRLEGRAAGFEGPVPGRWWLDGDGGLLDPDGTFTAERPGRFTAMLDFGALRARLPMVAEPRTRRGVFQLVGRGPTTDPRTTDLWVFRGSDGRDWAYTGSTGGDRVRVWDVTDPASPVLTDSIVVDARVINDAMVDPESGLGVLTREGASNRRNGIVLFDASDPGHPRVISEYTETVTAGVHNAYLQGDYVYLTNDGTRALHVISVADPLEPVEVARWEVRPGETNKYLHDVIVQDGLAYLSYWDDGLVILDVGNGVRDGSPEDPRFVSRIAYPEGNTHTAWRWKNWVFTGDEIFGGPPVSPRGGVPDGSIHVIDVTDLENPVEVAWFEVPDAGSHNIWMDEEREILFVSYYNAGVRALDVSGTLRGDLGRQGRELAFFLTGEPDPAKAAIPNAPMNWGPQLHEGLVFSSDMNSGLWVLRYEEAGAGISTLP